MKMTQFQKDFVRMLDSMREEHKGETTCVGIEDKECEECLLATICGDNDICFNAEKIIEIVTQWAKEHPFITNADKFEKVWGHKPVRPDGGWYCPSIFKELECNSSTDYDKCTSEFWNSEYKPPKSDKTEVDA